MNWINVNDRLPEDDKTGYLCWDEGVEIYEWTGTKWIEPYFGKTVKPKYWQPLPEPPNGE